MYQIFCFNTDEPHILEELCIPVETLNDVRSAILEDCEIVAHPTTPEDERALMDLNDTISYAFTHWLTSNDDFFFIVHDYFGAYKIKEVK